MGITPQLLVRQPLEEVEVLAVLMSAPIFIIIIRVAQVVVALHGTIKNMTIPVQRGLQDKVTQVVMLGAELVAQVVAEKGLLEQTQMEPEEMEVLV